MKPFYIIGHNPNNLSDAIDCLYKGANALEPDITYIRGEYYITEHIEGITLDSNKPTLAQYCSQLKDLLLNNPSFNLALIMWDIKDPTSSHGNFDEMAEIIMNNLITPLVDAGYGEIPILFTVPKINNFIKSITPVQLNFNWGIGIDEEDDVQDVRNALSPLRVNYSYADGISIGSSFNYRHSIRKGLEFKTIDNHLRLVYIWTVNSEDNMDFYFKMGVDGMNTDNPDTLFRLWLLNDYPNYSHLATKNDNPFVRDLLNEVWVDFNWRGIQNGDVNHPFNSIGKAHEMVADGGEIKIKPGIKSERITFKKRIRLNAPLKSVTIT